LILYTSNQVLYYWWSISCMGALHVFEFRRKSARLPLQHCQLKTTCYITRIVWAALTTCYITFKKCIWHEISYFLKWKNSLSCSVTYFSVSCFYGLFPRYFNLFECKWVWICPLIYDVMLVASSTYTGYKYYCATFNIYN
jgi:hypothetical protein